MAVICLFQIISCSGNLSLLLAPSSPTTQQYSIRPFVSHDLPSPTDKSSQSGYCCYVTTSSSFDASSYKANEHSLDKIPSKIVRGDSDSSHRVPSKGCNLSSVEASSKDSSSMGDISLTKNDCDSLPSISLSSSIDSSVGSNPPPPYYSPHQVMSRGISQEDSATVISSPSSRGQTPTPRPSYISQHPDSSPKVTNSPQFIYTANSSVVGPTTLPPPSPPLPKMVPACQKLHPPNAFCRTCLSVRRSHRQNAAAFFRRANLNSCPHNRRSAPSPVSTGDSFDDAPSILERLKKEWQMGSLSSYNQNDDSEAAPEQPSKCQSDVTTPYVTQTSAAQISEGNVNLNEIKCKQSQLRASSRRREPSCERKVDYGTPNDSPGKRDVTDLDKALNKLSFKRNASNQTHAKPPCVPSNHSRTFYNAVVSEVHNTSERANVPFNPTSDQGITIKVAHTVDKENGNADSMVNDGTDKVNCN